jgi:hypothetical protein
MASYLTVLEVDHEFLWIPERKRYLNDIVRILYDKLTCEDSLEDISFCVPFDYQNALMFRFQTKFDKQQEIRSYDVPIFIS